MRGVGGARSESQGAERSAEDTEKQLDLAIDRGRYGELFDYDADTGELVSAEIVAALGRIS